MAIQVNDYLNVAERALALGCLVPENIVIMPENFATAKARDDFRVRAEGATVRTLFRNHNFPLAELRPSEERSIAIHNKSADWETTIFVAASLITNNPDFTSTMLTLLQYYLRDFFKAEPNKNIKITVISSITSKEKYKEITYEGDIDGLSTLKDSIEYVCKS
jgi:hypothetical protein